MKIMIFFSQMFFVPVEPQENMNLEEIFSLATTTSQLLSDNQIRPVFGGHPDNRWGLFLFKADVDGKQAGICPRIYQWS